MLMFSRSKAVVGGLLLGLFLSSLLFAFQMPSKGKVTCVALNVREGPGMSFTVLGSIPEGTVVNITGVTGSWYKVNVDSYSGKYVFSGYIDVTESTEVDEKEAAKNPYPTLSHTDPKRPATSNFDPSLSPKTDF